MSKDDRRQTLLIVDDEPGLLLALRNQFVREYRVLTAEGGHEALNLLRREDVHVILSDQRMPGMTGDAFLAQARHVRPDAVRILFTGYTDLQSVITAINDGQIFRYILKPWDPVELDGIVRQAVNHYTLIEERNRLSDELRSTRDRLSRLDRELIEANELKRALLETARLRTEFDELVRRVATLEAAGAIPPSPLETD